MLKVTLKVTRSLVTAGGTVSGSLPRPLLPLSFSSYFTARLPPTPQSSSLAHPPTHPSSLAHPSTHPPSLARASPGNEKTHPSQERRTLPAPRLRPRPPGRPPLLPRLGATDPAFVREPEPANFLRQVGPGLLSSPLFLPPSRPRPSRRLNSKGRREEEGQSLTPC